MTTSDKADKRLVFVEIHGFGQQTLIPAKIGDLMTALAQRETIITSARFDSNVFCLTVVTDTLSDEQLLSVLKEHGYSGRVRADD